MTSWKLVDLKNRWDTLNNDLNLVSENLALKSADLPAVSSQSSNEEFHLLVASLRALRADINDFGSDIKTQTDTLSLDVRHFYDLAKEYDTEIEIYRKGREQAFGLYDNLSTEHKGLLHEFESLKAEFKVVSRDFDGARSRLEQIELESSILRKSNRKLTSS
jgi:hypothetical protein